VKIGSYVMCCGVKRLQIRNGRSQDTKMARCQTLLKLSNRVSRRSQYADDIDDYHADDDVIESKQLVTDKVGFWWRWVYICRHCQPVFWSWNCDAGAALLTITHTMHAAVRLFVYIYFLVESSTSYICLTSVKEVMRSACLSVCCQFAWIAVNEFSWNFEKSWVSGQEQLVRSWRWYATSRGKTSHSCCVVI